MFATPRRSPRLARLSENSLPVPVADLGVAPDRTSTLKRKADTPSPRSLRYEDDQSQSQSPSAFTSPQLTHTTQRPVKRSRPNREPGRGSVKRARLTKRNLAAHTAISSVDMPKRKRKGSQTTSKSNTTTTDKEFGRKLILNGIEHRRLLAPSPLDIEAVKAVLNNPRESNSPESEAYERYVQDPKTSWTQYTDGYQSYPNIAWTEVDTDLSHALSHAKPNHVEAYRKTAYSKEAQEELGSDLGPTQYGNSWGSFAAEFKGYDGSMEEAKLQTAYDGALMVENAVEVEMTFEQEGGETAYGRTLALTVAFNGVNVRIYADYATRSVLDGAVVYHHHEIVQHNPTTSKEAFKMTVRHVRNAQDYSRELASRRKVLTEEAVRQSVITASAPPSPISLNTTGVGPSSTVRHHPSHRSSQSKSKLKTKSHATQGANIITILAAAREHEGMQLDQEGCYTGTTELLSVQEAQRQLIASYRLEIT
ncbi:hypothetical protein LTR60_000011 [Cryomyces antarcticus]|nr:hypothetical protein LTR60_000011 [Cryomyces antarcticus]